MVDDMTSAHEVHVCVYMYVAVISTLPLVVSHTKPMSNNLNGKTVGTHHR